MNKFTILFLTMFLALPMAMKADSAKEKKDDTRYLVGACLLYTSDAADEL